MSERILRALIQLFAIIAKADEEPIKDTDSQAISSTGFQIIHSFLLNEMSEEKVQEYLDLFKTNYADLRKLKKSKTGNRKQNSVNSVKVLRICSEINEELTRRQKIIVLVRILELIMEDGHPSTQELAFVSTVADIFKIEDQEFELIKEFVISDSSNLKSQTNLLVLTGNVTKDINSLHVHSLEENIPIIWIESQNLLFAKAPKHIPCTINGQILKKNRIYILNQGSTLKTNRSQSIYHSEILNKFLDKTGRDNFIFDVTNISYSFSEKNIGVHPVTFSVESGNLVGIMGGSGTGKSTLVNTLNGSLYPSTGQVTINGFDIHREPKQVEGIIGHVSQDDLLIEELNVFENLFYSAKLSFGGLKDREISRKVIKLLKDLGLYEVKDLKVGNPLDKTISGGQRKRLNIGLELIREPSILFVDEPTSGLSSRDSMNIMNLLKELSFKGKLIFVVIHQPSSDIFKLFDRLLILDQGGYTIFDGDPIDSLVYFKTALNYVNADERECLLCGNVNPEQIFDIVEAKVVDEFGNNTGERKIKPIQWYKRYRKEKIKNDDKKFTQQVKSTTFRPKRFKQFRIFFIRDFLSKISNKQYVLVTLLEAPLLAVILAFFLKYFFQADQDYIFYKNENLPQYLFISVVVSLFLGMTVAAEEINKDKKILKRESFLNLSRSSYLFSKTSILVLISLIQSGSFVFIGNYILEIEGQWLSYWMILFTTSVWANIVGLNISSAFNLAKVIYIIVPILIIPQLLFSGAIVKFDKLHPSLAHANEVPWIGNIMTSRWAYEALVVEQAKNNEFEAQFYSIRQKRSDAKWIKDYWIPEMKNLVRTKENIQLLENEVSWMQSRYSNLNCVECFNQQEMNKTGINSFIRTVQNKAVLDYNIANDSLEVIKSKMGHDIFQALKMNFGNEALKDLVTHRFEVEKIKINPKTNRLLKTDDPIYSIDNSVRLLDSPMYSPYKFIGNTGLSTFFVNMSVIWIFSILCFVALYYDLLKKAMDYFRRKNQ